MVISKELSIGSLDVDTQKGIIWLNSPSCVLRITNLKFELIKEKFSMIDVKGNTAAMLDGDLIEDEASDSVRDIASHIYLAISKIEKINLEEFSQHIKDCVDSYLEKKE